MLWMLFEPKARIPQKMKELRFEVVNFLHFLWNSLAFVEFTCVCIIMVSLLIAAFVTVTISENKIN
ncbi:hypothetical protein B1R32_11215 [Abditibacterium utsteinense]|uniref:Uncharacterized protein n=1 Tax=Abditibacterium utsteinense TaxID=1960156 RepID=A0A2S8SRD8_9BACT|nr:hypothetical protein B1R32_11215 [Abditibacterium utsteinense]